MWGGWPGSLDWAGVLLTCWRVDARVRSSGFRVSGVEGASFSLLADDSDMGQMLKLGTLKRKPPVREPRPRCESDSMVVSRSGDAWNLLFVGELAARLLERGELLPVVGGSGGGSALPDALLPQFSLGRVQKGTHKKKWGR